MEKKRLYLKCDKDFIAFIKQFIEYSIFIERLSDNKLKLKNRKWKSLDTYCKDLKRSEYIYQSFDWDKTTEGFIWWEWLNNKWLDYLNNKFKL